MSHIDTIEEIIKEAEEGEGYFARELGEGVDIRPSTVGRYMDRIGGVTNGAIDIERRGGRGNIYTINDRDEATQGIEKIRERQEKMERYGGMDTDIANLVEEELGPDPEVGDIIHILKQQGIGRDFSRRIATAVETRLEIREEYGSRSGMEMSKK